MRTWIDDVEEYCLSTDSDLLYFSGRITPLAAREFVDLVLAGDKHANQCLCFFDNIWWRPAQRVPNGSVLEKALRGRKNSPSS